jgi:transcriptional regulator with XRE-family HTH domain
MRAVVNRLPEVLRSRGLSWGELSRRTFLSPRLIERLRRPSANPRLIVAERVARAIGVPLEQLWELAPRRR